MYVVEKKDEHLMGLPAHELKHLGFSEQGQKILKTLAQQPAYPKEIARQLNVHEQKVYYHIHMFEKKGLIHVVRKEDKGGAVAKWYGLVEPAFVVRFKELEHMEKIPATVQPLFEPFIANGSLNGKIVIGSPDPHGPERARARDINAAVDFALFLGTFLNMHHVPAVSIDTDVRQSELAENLILIGGPVTNKVTKLFNDSLPIRFDAKKNIYSTRTKKRYTHDESALLIQMPNPRAQNKHLLIIAGKRHAGTRAAVLLLLKSGHLIQKKSKGIVAHVIEGIDEDGDGIVDHAKILE
ncbi:MAG: S-layer protein [Candidatus Aenigmarchaeota archaeon]|nr:S-layer protein [Candidatus Aenigmarchaeota archaeon]